MMGSKRQNSAMRRDSSLTQEAICLFGRQTVEQAKRMRPDEVAVEAELVAEGARQLRQQVGHPDKQRAIIRAMDEETAAALCRWIIEPHCMAGFIAKGLH